MDKETEEEKKLTAQGYFKSQTDIIMKLCENCGCISDDAVCPKCKTKKVYTLTEYYRYSKKQ